jgi:hypothetical protein
MPLDGLRFSCMRSEAESAGRQPVFGGPWIQP